MTRALPLALLAALGFGCSSSDETHAAPRPAPDTTPPYDAVWQIATHNSYWVDRGAQNDFFASGVSERLVDQLAGDGARAVEIDVHRDTAAPGRWRVYHTAPGNSLCQTLAECLTTLRTFHAALPEHEVVQVILELKELVSSNFDATHSFDDLDAELREGLGALLYEPRELLARCGTGATPASCVTAEGWPTVASLRGRFVVAVLGNWDTLGAVTTADWAHYALSRPGERAAFSMVSTWKTDWSTLPDALKAAVSASDLARAVDESALAQVEDVADPLLAPLLARHALVRIDGATTEADQAARVALGAQLLQTDLPWQRWHDGGPARPFSPLDPALPALYEPGARLALGPAPVGGQAVAYLARPARSTTTWSATLTSGHDAGRAPCWWLGPTPGTAGPSVRVCRARVGAALDPAAEAVEYVVTRCAGTCADERRRPAYDAAADRSRVTVTSTTDGESCVLLETPADVASDGTAHYARLGDPICVPGPLPAQGLARADSVAGSARYLGLVADELGARALAGSRFSAVSLAASGAVTPSPGLLVDETR